MTTQRTTTKRKASTKKRRSSSTKKAAAPRKNAKPASAVQFMKNLPKASADGEGFQRMSDSLMVEVHERLPTGLFAMDKLTGGGWPVGKIIEIAAWESAGKSTLVDQSIAEMQRQELATTALLDTENARDEPYMRRLGVNLDTLITTSGVRSIELVFARIEELLETQRKVMAAGPANPLFIVWDSLGASATENELAIEVTDERVAQGAKSVRAKLRRIVMALPETRTTLLVINHFWKELGGQYAKKHTYGGTAMRFFPHFKLELTKRSPVKNGMHVIGHEVVFTTKKSKITKILPDTKAGLIYGSGFDNSYTLFDWALEHGEGDGHRYVLQRGAWYYLHNPGEEPVAFQSGFVGFGKLLVEQPALYQKLASRYLEPLSGIGDGDV